MYRNFVKLYEVLIDKGKGELDHSEHVVCNNSTVISSLMSRIEIKCCLLITSYMAGLLTFSYYFIFDTSVCVLVTFYR